MKQLKNILGTLKRFWKKIAIAVVVVLVGFFIAKKTVLKPPPQYETSTIEVSTLKKTLEVSGEVNADQKAVLKFQTTGKLAWVGVEQGDRVNKWQAIASLDKSILNKKLQQELNDFNHELQQHDQVKEDNQVTTVNNLDEYSFTDAAEREVIQAQMELRNVVLDLEIQDITNKYATLVSPIAGIVTDIDTPVAGVNVALTDAFTVVDPETLYFEVEIDETDIGTVSIGQTAEIILESFPNEPIQSQITWIDFAASTSDSGGTVFKAKLSLPLSEETRFRLGMTGDATIVLEEKQQVLSVPLDALEETDDQVRVKVLENSQAVEKTIETGIETDDDIEVVSGLNAGEVVITGEKEK